MPMPHILLRARSFGARWPAWQLLRLLSLVSRQAWQLVYLNASDEKLRLQGLWSFVAGL